jgi:hypothetical protein
MGLIETAAQVPMKPLLLANGVVLTQSHRSAIATWAALKTVIGEYTCIGPRGIPVRCQQHLYSKKSPPDDWVISIGVNEERHGVGFQHFVGADNELLQGPQPVSPSIRTTALWAGHLFFYVVSSDHPGFTYIPQRAHPELLQVWPPRVGDCDWSRPPLVPARRLKQIADLAGSLQKSRPY